MMLFGRARRARAFAGRAFLGAALGVAAFAVGLWGAPLGHSAARADTVRGATHVNVAPPAGPTGTSHVAVAAPLPKRADTHVYLMRGLFGVFSLGMDSLATQLTGAGYRSDVYAWDTWPQVAALVVQRYQEGHRGPVVVIGHSLGANAVFSVADSLRDQNIPVQLGVTFDATDPALVPDNVLVFINFWARDGFGRPVDASPAYAGQLVNFDLSDQPGIDHTSIDSLDRFHQLILARLEGMTAP